MRKRLKGEAFSSMVRYSFGIMRWGMPSTRCETWIFSASRVAK